MRVDGVTPVDTTAAAAAAPTVDPKLHEAALQFEELLVRQLTQAMADSAKGPEGEDGGDAASSFYADQLPETLASSIKDAGGLGLAAELEKAMVIGQ
jgi:Rod binding domain-containing protein